MLPLIELYEVLNLKGGSVGAPEGHYRIPLQYAHFLPSFNYRNLNSTLPEIQILRARMYVQILFLFFYKRLKRDERGRDRKKRQHELKSRSSPGTVSRTECVHRIEKQRVQAPVASRPFLRALTCRMPQQG